MKIEKLVEAIRNRHNLRMRHDEDDSGSWVTTENGHKIHINENGAIDGGNQFALATMGKPKGLSMPEKSVKLKDAKVPYHLTNETRDALGEALSKRQDKEVVFGGYYKVAESGGSLRTATFFNPYTGDHFGEIIDDTDDDRVYYDPFRSQLREMGINEKAAWLWKRSNGIIQTDDKIRVVKGRTIPHGTEAKVKAVRPIRNKYGYVVADYAYLDNGQKININNIEIVED